MSALPTPLVSTAPRGGEAGAAGIHPHVGGIGARFAYGGGTDVSRMTLRRDTSGIATKGKDMAGGNCIIVMSSNGMSSTDDGWNNVGRQAPTYQPSQPTQRTLNSIRGSSLNGPTATQPSQSFNQTIGHV
jgi:hypothetical protein